jgi:hypothetical protein
MEQSVSKRRHIKFRRRGITQKKAYNIQDTAKVRNQGEGFLFKYDWLFGQEVGYVTLLTDQSELSFKKKLLESVVTLRSPHILGCDASHTCNVSFELCGSRNLHDSKKICTEMHLAVDCREMCLRLFGPNQRTAPLW